MSGNLIEITGKQQHDFSYLGANESETIVVTRAINTIPYYHGSLWVRIHNNRSSGATVKVKAIATSPSSFDQQEFSLSTAAMDTGDMSAVSAPGLVASYATEQLPPFVQIQLEVTQSATPVSIFFELSVDLLVRSA